MEFLYDPEKNAKLMCERGVCFEDVIEAIADDRLLLDVAHPNREKYPHQRLMIVEIARYTYAVSYLMDGEVYVLKTVYPDRRYKKLLEVNDGEEIPRR